MIDIINIREIIWLGNQLDDSTLRMMRKRQIFHLFPKQKSLIERKKLHIMELPRWLGLGEPGSQQDGDNWSLLLSATSSTDYFPQLLYNFSHPYWNSNQHQLIWSSFLFFFKGSNATIIIVAFSVIADRAISFQPKTDKICSKSNAGIILEWMQ